MKKIIIFFLFLFLNSFSYFIVNANENSSINIENIIKNTCNGREKFNDFYYWYDCSWEEKELFYIKEQKVTKEKYDSEKTIYNEKWPICEETKISTTKELPKDFSTKCVKWFYGEYYYKEKNLKYSDWINKISLLSFSSLIENQNIEIQKNLDIQKTQLESINSFINSIKDKTYKGSIYSIIWWDCFWDGDFTYNWNWDKNLVCENNKIKSLDYVVDNKIVSFDVYINKMYEYEKKILKEQIENNKQNNLIWNTEISTINNETIDSKKDNITKSAFQDSIIKTEDQKLEEITKIKTWPEVYIIILISFWISILLFNRKKSKEF